METTFLILSDSSDKFKIDKLHLNLWYVKKTKVYLDLGILVDLDRAYYQSQDSLSFEIRTPISIETDTFRDLYDLLSKQDNLQLLFNDEVKGISHAVTSTSRSKKSCLVSFSSGPKFLLMEIGHYNISKNSIGIKLDINKTRKENIIEEFNKPGDTVQGRSKDDRKESGIKLYIRFRYRIDLKDTSVIFDDSGFLYKKLFLDFRFTELRAFISQDIYPKIVKIIDAYIFTIIPVNYQIVLDSRKEMRYARLLEKQNELWCEYIPEIKNEKQKYLVYYWRDNLEEIKPNSTFEILVSFLVEDKNFTQKTNFTTLLTLVGVILSVLIAYNPLKFCDGFKQTLMIICLAFLIPAILMFLYSLYSIIRYKFLE